MIIAVATNIADDDRVLINRMLTKFLSVDEKDIQILDSRSYRPSFPEGTQGVITYGRAAWMAVRANNGLDGIPVLKLADIKKLHRKPENKENIQEVVDNLNGWELEPKPSAQDKIVSINFKDDKGKIIEVKEDGDILPEELEDLVSILRELNLKELKVVFHKQCNDCND